MKKLLLLSVFVLAISALPVLAQNTEYSSYRLGNLASNLKRQTVDLSDKLYSEYKNRYGTNSRSDTEQLFLAQQMDSAAYTFQQMVRDNRRSGELRDAAAIMYDLARRSSYNSSYQWRDI